MGKNSMIFVTLNMASMKKVIVVSVERELGARLGKYLANVLFQYIVTHLICKIKYVIGTNYTAIYPLV